LTARGNLRGRNPLESVPVENLEQLDSNRKKKESLAFASGEHKEERKIFFLTRSLAEVYAKQGHVSIALEIYRKMLKTNPSDHDIEKRMAELESHPSAKRSIKSKEQET
jgi:tetratricopeptide (TPR) repeat protein